MRYQLTTPCLAFYCCRHRTVLSPLHLAGRPPTLPGHQQRRQHASVSSTTPMHRRDLTYEERSTNPTSTAFPTTAPTLPTCLQLCAGPPHSYQILVTNKRQPFLASILAANRSAHTGVLYTHHNLADFGAVYACVFHTVAVSTKTQSAHEPG